MKKRFEAEIEKRGFNAFEMAGFMTQPKLALMVGAAIGYQIACDDFKKQHEQFKEIGGRLVTLH